MQGEYFDGLTARTHIVTVVITADAVIGEGPTASFRWLRKGLRLVEVTGRRMRLAPPTGDGRLVVDAGDWEAATGISAGRFEARMQRREHGLVAALAIAGVSLAALIFIGVPLAARPLAQATPPQLEVAFGRNMSRQLLVVLKPCTGNADGQASLDRLARRLSAGASLRFPIRVILVQAPMINAFALPGGSILVTDRLIAEAGSPDELAGVLAHEIAHVEKRHVMEAVWRSMGLGLVVEGVVGGGSGAGQQAVLLASNFTEQRYSRALESEADSRAYELLENNRISTAGFANFFERMADRTSPEGVKTAAEWLSTHPDSGKRAIAARVWARPGAPALAPGEWMAVKRMCPRAPRRLKTPWSFDRRR